MNNYHFQTNEFGITDTGIHLLRSRFNFKTINFSEINKIKIEEGREIHNWLLVFVLGSVLIVFGMYLSIGTIRVLIEGNVKPLDARMIFFLLVPVVGGLFIYNSLQTGIVLKVDYANGIKDMFPLRELVKAKKLRELKLYLKEKVGTRIQLGD